MANLFNYLFFIFKILLLSNYFVKYCDYIVKWCSGIACNWCVSLDIVIILSFWFMSIFGSRLVVIIELCHKIYVTNIPKHVTT